MRKLFILSIAALGMLACADSNVPDKIVGALPGQFSVNARKKVQFSQGNLQYQASTRTWRFAENQYDLIGNANENISDTYSGWIDLFGWGTGNNPTLWSKNSIGDYSVFVDWGTNAVSNGDIGANLWRTLRGDEWEYLFRKRSNAEKLFGLGSVSGVKGTIMLPDNWTTSGNLVFHAGTEKGLRWESGEFVFDDEKDHYEDNVYTPSEWAKMEMAGAVFLPAAGHRSGTDVFYAGSGGAYWSATPYSDQSACNIEFSWIVNVTSGTNGQTQKRFIRLDPNDAEYRSTGLSVRLVH